MARQTSSVLVRDVRKVYPPNIVALDGLSLEVREGEFVSLIGPSGCGKTTLMRIIAGLEDYQEGAVFFNSEPIRSNASWRRSVIYQDIRLFPWMKVRENVMFALRCKGLPLDEAQASARYWIDALRLTSFTDKYPRELSAGVRQKVGLCRVLANSPDLIMCDEPFSALDWPTREFLQIQLLRYWHEHRKTVIFVTHNVEEAVFLAQRVICMTARPGLVKETVCVPLPEARWEVPRDAPELLEVSQHVAALIQDEVARAQKVEKEVGY